MRPGQRQRCRNVEISFSVRSVQETCTRRVGFRIIRVNPALWVPEHFVLRDSSIFHIGFRWAVKQNLR